MLVPYTFLWKIYLPMARILHHAPNQPENICLFAGKSRGRQGKEKPPELAWPCFSSDRESLVSETGLCQIADGLFGESVGGPAQCVLCGSICQALEYNCCEYV